MKTYTETEMLAIWRSRLGFDEVHTGCTVESFDGHDVDSRIRQAMRAWYLRLLDTAQARLLPCEQVEAASTQVYGRRQLLIRLPDRCRRPLRMHADRWCSAASPDSSERTLVDLQRLASPFGWPDDSCPIVCLLPDGAVVAAPLEPDNDFSIYAVVEPADGSYTLDESLLDTIPNRLTDYCYE